GQLPQLPRGLPAYTGRRPAAGGDAQPRAQLGGRLDERGLLTQRPRLLPAPRLHRPGVVAVAGQIRPGVPAGLRGPLLPEPQRPAVELPGGHAGDAAGPPGARLHLRPRAGVSGGRGTVVQALERDQTAPDGVLSGSRRALTIGLLLVVSTVAFESLAVATVM